MIAASEDVQHDQAAIRHQPAAMTPAYGGWIASGGGVEVWDRTPDQATKRWRIFRRAWVYDAQQQAA